MPLAATVARAPTAEAPAAMSPDSRRRTVSPVASVIWEATVRRHTISYTSASDFGNSRRTSSGWRNRSPAGRMASWASWALRTLLA